MTCAASRKENECRKLLYLKQRYISMELRVGCGVLTIETVERRARVEKIWKCYTIEVVNGESEKVRVLSCGNATAASPLSTNQGECKI